MVISGHQGRQRQRSRATPDEGRNQWSSVVIRRQIVRDPYLLPRALRRLSLRNRPRLQPRLRARSMQPSRARGRQKRVAAVGVSPVLGGSKQCMRREQPDEGGNQRSSVVIRSNACATSSLMRKIIGAVHRCESEVIRGHPRSSEVLRGPQRSSEVLRGPQRSSEVIRGPQRPSEALRGHQRPSPGRAAHAWPRARLRSPPARARACWWRKTGRPRNT